MTLFVTTGAVAYSACFVLLAAVVISSRVGVRLVLKSIKPLAFIIVFTAALNIFYTQNGTILWQWWIFTVRDEGIYIMLFMISRILMLVVGTSMLTYTTSPIALTDGIESLLGPFKRVGLPVHELAMMMTIALRFIPALIEETDKIMSAQKARGANMDSGGPVKRAKAMVPVLLPLFISAFRRADELATAMECRCYRGGVGRTRLRELKAGSRDIWALTLSIMASAAIITAGIFLI